MKKSTLNTFHYLNPMTLHLFLENNSATYKLGMVKEKERIQGYRAWYQTQYKLKNTSYFKINVDVVSPTISYDYKYRINLGNVNKKN